LFVLLRLSNAPTKKMKVPTHYQYNFGCGSDKSLTKLQRRFDKKAIQEGVEEIEEEKEEEKD